MKRSIDKIKLQKTVNPNTGEEGQRLAVVTSLGEVVRIWTRDESVDDVVAKLKADAASVKAKLVYYTGEFGAYYAISGAEDIEEF